MILNSNSEAVDLTGQVAIVTGGGRGIGQAFAVSLASAGATVVVISRSSDQLAETVKLIQENKGRGYAHVADVTDRYAIEHAVKQIESELGAVDILVNNAATMLPIGPIWEVNPDEWWRCMDINLRGPFLCARAVLPGMIKRRSGCIINVSTGAAVMDIPYLSAYIVSKCALIRFTDSLAAETAQHGISVFAISPGTVRTAMTEYTIQSPEGQKWMPWFKEFYDSASESPSRATQLLLRLASGSADVLSGRFIYSSDNVAQLVKRVEEIKQDKLYTLKVSKLG